MGEIAAREGLVNYAVESYRRAGNRNKAKQLTSSNPDFFGPVLEMERLGLAAPEEEETEDIPLGLSILEKLEKAALEGKNLEPPEKDAQQAARDSMAKARKKKWKKKKK